MAESLRCAIYARYSTELQDGENSIERQISACRAWATRAGHRVLTEYTYLDAAKSGTSLLARPAMQQLLALLKARAPVPFDALLVDEDSRLDRGGKLAELVESFGARGVRILCADGGTDLTDERSRLLTHVKSGMNEEYVRELARRTREGLRAKVTRGFAAGAAPYGYRNVSVWPEGLPVAQRSRDNRIGARVEIDPAAAEIVRGLFAGYAAGDGLRDLTHRLNAARVPSPRGGTWDHTAVRGVLLNPKYAGCWEWGKTRWRKLPEALLDDDQVARVRASGRSIRQPHVRPEEERVGGQLEALRIVDDATWRAVQARFAARRSGPGRTIAPRHLLSGLMQCSCGANIVVTRSWRSGPRPAEFGCPRHGNRGPTVCSNGLTIPAPVLADQLFAALRERVLNPQTVARLIERANRLLAERGRRSTTAKRAAALGAEARDLEAQLGRLAAAIAGGLDLGAVRAEMQARQARLDEVRDELAQLAAPRREATLQPFTRAEIEAALARFWELLGSAGVSRANHALRGLLGPVRVAGIGQKGEEGWQITFSANPLSLYLPAAYFRGSGGGI